ncbi:MAG: hypothetical protein Q4B26_14095 [Eubacteriales bacterium]|nr:hypothetical protein [Eubacteriales bacterium]
MNASDITLMEFCKRVSDILDSLGRSDGDCDGVECSSCPFHDHCSTLDMIPYIADIEELDKCAEIATTWLPPKKEPEKSGEKNTGWHEFHLTHDENTGHDEIGDGCEAPPFGEAVLVQTWQGRQIGYFNRGHFGVYWTGCDENVYAWCELPEEYKP